MAHALLTPASYTALLWSASCDCVWSSGPRATSGTRPGTTLISFYGHPSSSAPAPFVRACLAFVMSLWPLSAAARTASPGGRLVQAASLIGGRNRRRKGREDGPIPQHQPRHARRRPRGRFPRPNSRRASSTTTDKSLAVVVGKAAALQCLTEWWMIRFPQVRQSSVRVDGNSMFIWTLATKEAEAGL